jgi:hypothetical protein
VPGLAIQRASSIRTDPLIHLFQAEGHNSRPYALGWRPTVQNKIARETVNADEVSRSGANCE